MKQEIIYIFKGFVFLNKKIGNLDLFTDRQKYPFEATIVGALIFIVLTLGSINQKLTVITENFKTNTSHIKAEG